MAVSKTRLQLVFIVLRLVLLTVIAVALVKFAFFPNTEEDDATNLDPSGTFGELTVMPETGDITNTLKLTGSIDLDSAKPVKATSTGEINAVFIKDGSAVGEGDRVAQLCKEVEVPGTPTTDEEGNTIPGPSTTACQYIDLHASASGTLNLAVTIGQTVNAGDTIASVQPDSYTASGTISPEQMYRLQDLPSTATILINNGPAPFECTNLRVSNPRPNAGAANNGETSGASDGIKLLCNVPSEQKVFHGLKITMEVIAGQATGVLTVPLTAVEGRFEVGAVYIPGDKPGNPQRVEVELGISDDERIEIKSGLTAEQEILEFLPENANSNSDMLEEGMAEDAGAQG